MQVHRQPPLTITTLTFNPRRFKCRVGLCIRCSHQRLLSFISHSLPSTATLAANYPQGLLGVSLDREYPLSCGVSVLYSCNLISLTPKSSFAQYTYGIYLGLNGKSLLSLSLNLDKPVSVYSVAISRPFRASVVASTSILYCLHHFVARIQRSPIRPTCLLSLTLNL